MNEEFDNVNHPKHYCGVAANIECIDITRRLPFDLGNAFKYVWRAGKKGDKAKALEDLDKALWYLDDYAARVGDVNGLGVSTANAVFGLLLTGKSTRYLALREIVSGRINNAAEYIWRMKREFENEPY